MLTKTLRGVEVKDEAQGLVEAVFSTFDVIDADGDVTLRTAIDDGAPTRISAYGHASWMGALPVGKGVIRVGAKDAVLQGQFFLNTTVGRETFEVVKAMGDMQEWSYGYDAVKFSHGEQDGRRVRFLEQLKVHEVSPVLIGVGVDTRTLATKSAGGLTFAGEAELVVASVTALADRAADVMAKRAEKGKGLGAESAALLEQVEQQLQRLSGLLKASPEPVPDTTDPDLVREYLRSVARNLTRSAA